jgi:hypothetical protein
MATVNYEILRPELPAAVGGSVASGISTAQQIGAQQLQNQLGQLQLAQAGQEITEQNKLRELMASGVDLDSPEAVRKMYEISPKQGMAFEKSRAELTKTRTDAKLKQFEADQQRYSNLAFNPSNENTIANLQDMVLERRISPEQAAQMQQKILAMPIEERGKFFLAMGADAKTRYTHGTVSAGTAASNAVTMRGQNMADARARERLAFEMNPEVQAQLAGAKETGKAQAQAAITLPAAVSTAKEGIRKIDELLKAPGFSTTVGATLQPGARFVPGTDAADFMARLDEIKGGAFMQAFNSLKGGGQITEKEGEKATAAITRMSIAQSEGEFVKAAKEFQDVLRQGIKNAESKAGKSAKPSGSGVIDFNDLQ